MRLTLAKIGWMAVVPAVAAISVSAINHKRAAVVTSMKVDIEDVEEGRYFLTEEDLLKELKALVGEKQYQIDELRADEIEAALETNPFIDEVDVYVSSDGELSLKVEQKVPVARIFDASGKSFYIDEAGDAIPLSPYFSARVPVVTGHVKPIADPESKAYGQWVAMHTFINTIGEDDFLNAFVEQVYVARNQSITLIPKVGNTEIQFGPLENTEAKIENLKAFYKKVMVADGWDLYKRIDLSYDGQVVCTKVEKPNHN